MNSQILQKLIGARIQKTSFLGNGDMDHVNGTVVAIQDHLGNPMLVSDQDFTYVMTPECFDHYLATGYLLNAHASSDLIRLVTF